MGNRIFNRERKYPLRLLERSDPFLLQVLLIFKDSGCGIRKEDLGKIFEPFFTLKPTGKGTGLGLSICDKIVKQHKGKILIESQVNRGTQFTVILPIKLD